MSFGQTNYDNALQSLRRPSADQIAADVITSLESAIQSQKASIAMLREIVGLKDEQIAMLRETIATWKAALRGTDAV